MINSMFKKWVFWLFVLSLVGLLMSFVLRNATDFNICLQSEPSCIVSLTKVSIGLFYGMGALAVVFFALLFAPKAVSAWWKFAIFYIPYYIYAVLTAGPSAGQMIYIGMSVQETAIWLSGIYVVVSLVLIALSLRKKN